MTYSIKRSLFAIVVALCACCAAEDVAALPVKIAPADPLIHYVGRFDRRDAAGPRCAWPGCTIQAKFTGTAVNVLLKDTGNVDRFGIYIDGKPGEILNLKPDQTLYKAASGLTPGEHTLEIFKRTESNVFNAQFQGLQLEAGQKLVDLGPALKRRIEIIGDSITCGYGNEGASQNEHFKPDTENNYLAYGPVAARAVGAECSEIAWSGRKLAPDNTIVSIYDYALPQDKASTWDFSAWAADAVVINLCTNDFGKGNPDEKMWTDAYRAFIQHIRKNYPNAHIFCAVGSMMNDGWPPGQKALSTVRGYINTVIEACKKDGDTKVHYVEFEPQDQKNGLGSDWHPSVKTHKLMADKLVEALKKELGW